MSVLQWIALLAAVAGYIVLVWEALELLPKSQSNLLVTRGALLRHLIVLRAMGAAEPRFSGFRKLRFWFKNLSFQGKLSSFFGTAKRVYAKKFNRPCNVGEWMPKERRE